MAMSKDVDSPPLEITLAQYKKRGTLIGNGGFGHVFMHRLRDTTTLSQDLPKQIAVKEINSDMPNAEREVILCGLRHKNIVIYYGLPERRKGKIRIKMELALSNLETYQNNQGGSFSVPSFLPLALQVAEGLEYLHMNDIVHRDLKPKNVLVQKSQEFASSVVLKLCDFGLGRYVGETVMTLTAAGTLKYMAPEVVQAVKDERGFRGSFELADVYSLGVVYHHMLYNCNPESSPVEAGGSVSTLLSSMLNQESKGRINSVGVVVALKGLLFQDKPEGGNKCQSEHQIGHLAGQMLQLQKQQELQDSLLQDVSQLFQQLVQQQQSRPTTLSLSRSPSVRSVRESPSGSHVLWKHLAPSPELEKKLMVACNENKIEEVQSLLRQGADINYVLDGWSPLQRVCANGNLALAKLLIEKGADVSRSNEHGKTPLHRACHFAHLDTAKLLLRKGAESDSKDVMGNMPLDEVDPVEKEDFQRIFERFELSRQQ